MNSRRASAVERVVATVTLEPAGQRQAILDRIKERGDDEREDRLADNIRSPEGLRLQVRLSAEDATGQLISSDCVDFGLGLQRRGVAAIYHRYHGPPIPTGCDEVEFLQRNYRVGHTDIEDAINQMLGRDPDQHRPPRLAWDNLVVALTAARVNASETDLIATPLTVILTPEVKADLDLA
jgi:hypothetical protein